MASLVAFKLMNWTVIVFRADLQKGVTSCSDHGFTSYLAYNSGSISRSFHFGVRKAELWFFMSKQNKTGPPPRLQVKHQAVQETTLFQFMIVFLTVSSVSIVFVSVVHSHIGFATFISTLMQ